ncbi:hypothetical protein [Nonomuraea sp. B1E8]|uniref:ATP-grasp domain-containing protein n=1 Tax=unclassified Nonomuraea TaxID=2593643 RepID=UPI00325CECE9
MDHAAETPAPLLAVLHDVGSASAMQIAASARGLCELVFLADRSLPHVAEQLPLMRDLAEVVDITGLPWQQVCEEVVALRPSGVMTCAEHQIVGAAALARACGTPGHDEAVARDLTDKFRQREVLAERGVQSTACVPLYGPEDVAAAGELVGFPAVLKPRHGAASVDTCRVESAGEGMAVARRFAVGPDRPFVLEELLLDGPARPPLGDYVSVESVVQAGEISTFGITGSFPLAAPFRETGKAIPAMVTPSEAEQITALAHAAITALGVRDSLCHTEVKLTPQGPRIIEVNGRLGGWVGELTLRATGVDMVRAAMSVALGRPAELPSGAAPERVVFQYFVVCPQDSSEIVSIAPLEALAELPAVEWVETRVRDGQRISWRLGSLQQLAVLRGTVGRHEELVELVVAAALAVKRACR